MFIYIKCSWNDFYLGVYFGQPIDTHYHVNAVRNYINIKNQSTNVTDWIFSPMSQSLCLEVKLCLLDLYNLLLCQTVAISILVWENKIIFILSNFWIFIRLFDCRMYVGNLFYLFLLFVLTALYMDYKKKSNRVFPLLNKQIPRKTMQVFGFCHLGGKQILTYEFLKYVLGIWEESIHLAH